MPSTWAESPVTWPGGVFFTGTVVVVGAVVEVGKVVGKNGVVVTVKVLVGDGVTVGSVSSAVVLVVVGIIGVITVGCSKTELGALDVSDGDNTMPVGDVA